MPQPSTNLRSLSFRCSGQHGLAPDGVAAVPARAAEKCGAGAEPAPDDHHRQVKGSSPRPLAWLSLAAHRACVSWIYGVHGRASSSGLVPLDQLVVEAGKAVWVLHVDLVCLNSDGALFDAGLAAAVAALRDGALVGAPRLLDRFVCSRTQYRAPRTQSGSRRAATMLRSGRWW